MNKFFMLGLAGLAFAACSNDEDAINNALPEGVGAVSVKIVNPALTRAIVPATQGTAGTDMVTVVPQTGTEVSITLTAGTGGGTITLDPSEWGESRVVKFWNVTNPTKIEVSMNGGVASYDNVVIDVEAGAEQAATPDLQVLPEAIPVYGSTTQITLTSNEDSPNTANADHEYGANEGDEDVVFKMYEATVNLEIPVARLEVSDITFAGATPSTIFQTLTLGGVYMDNYKLTANATRSNHFFPGDNSGIGVSASVLYDAISAPNNNFLAENGVWPGQVENVDQAYAYNFYGPTAQEITAATTSDAKQQLNPKFKIYFSTAVAKEDAETVIRSPRYAMITKYKDAEDNDVVMQNGHIYRITDVELADGNIVPNEDGEEVYGVEVTVVEAKWTIVDIEADWAEQ